MPFDIADGTQSSSAGVNSQNDLINEAKDKFGIFAESLDDLQKKVRAKRSEALATAGRLGNDSSNKFMELSSFSRKVDDALIASISKNPSSESLAKKDDFGLAGLAKEAEAENDSIAGVKADNEEDELKKDVEEKPETSEIHSIKTGDDSILDQIDQMTGELRDARKNQRGLKDTVSGLKAELSEREQELDSITKRCDDLAKKIRDLSEKL